MNKLLYVSFEETPERAVFIARRAFELSGLGGTMEDHLEIFCLSNECEEILDAVRTALTQAGQGDCGAAAGYAFERPLGGNAVVADELERARDLVEASASFPIEFANPEVRAHQLSSILKIVFNDDPRYSAFHGMVPRRLPHGVVYGGKHG
ncbi:MAG: hypothetical protein KDD55_00995 [Bdellovibrionales bacterium]|nr:hypothetical protein [Bdellovibrionales bacterium]